MAYLGNGIYDLLDVIKASKNPSIAYEGLYQDPRRYDTTYYSGDLKTYPYGMTDASGAQALISSAFPQEYGVGSLFNPRVGRPEQSIYYNEPEPADPTSDFYQPIGDPFQTDYPITKAIQQDYYQPSRTFQDYYSGVYESYDPEKDDYDQVQKIQGPEKKGIGRLMEVLGNIPTPLNLLRKMLSNVGPGFIGPKGSRPYDYNESAFSTFGRSRTGKEFFQNMRDKKARQEAAQRGLEKQKEKARLDMTRAIRDIKTGGGDGGGIGSSYGGAASPGSKGPGGSDEMGSF